MALPQKYQNKESAIASYNYEDIASGTGYVIFYGASVQTETTTSYILTTQQIYSNDIDTGAGTSFDLDFDVVFNRPQRLRGNLICTFNISSGGGADAYAIVRVRKWNATDGETEIANAQSETKTIAGNGQATYAVEVPITAIQLFKKGDTLRITTDVQGTAAVYFHHDPMNRPSDVGFTLDTSQLKFHTPFVIDV